MTHFKDRNRLPQNGLARRTLLTGAAAGLAHAPVSGVMAQSGDLHALAKITFAHDYFGQTPLLIRAAPLSPVDFSRQSLRLGRNEGPLVLAQRQDAPRPASVRLQLFTDDPDFRAYTSVDGFPLGADQLYITNQTAPNVPNIRRMDWAEARALGMTPDAVCVLDLALPPVGEQDLTITFEVTKSRWVYYLQSQPNPLKQGGKDGDIEYWIEDINRVYSFENLGTRLDATGRRVDAFLSSAPIPLSAQHDQIFQLRRVVRTPGQASEFTIMLDRLPTATNRLDLPQPGEPENDLISRIYLSL